MTSDKAAEAQNTDDLVGFRTLSDAKAAEAPNPNDRPGFQRERLVHRDDGTKVVQRLVGKQWKDVT
jgi:hypothetical protein